MKRLEAVAHVIYLLFVPYIVYAHWYTFTAFPVMVYAWLMVLIIISWTSALRQLVGEGED